MPEFLQQRIAANVGGPVKIPGLFDWSKTTNFFLNYSGNHSDRPGDSYSTVPSAQMRNGDFPALSPTIRDPPTGPPLSGRLCYPSPRAAHRPQPNPGAGR